MPPTRLQQLLLGMLLLTVQMIAKTHWPQWDSYSAKFLDNAGRIVDSDANDRTTSEGQAYALFFALVANDRHRFDHILAWTENNLAQGDIGSHLPCWLWANEHGKWGVTDENSASDADLWIAYTLLEAGRHWREPSFTLQGLSLAHLILRREVVEIPGFGPMLLPGRVGFKTADHWYQMNASYLPVQLLLAMTNYTSAERWRAIAERVPAVLEGSSAKGFILDWIAYKPEDGFSTQHLPASTPLASYDAIRVYLWAGMMAPETPERSRILAAMRGMADYLEQNSVPPAQIDEFGQVAQVNGSVGFSAAVLPLLESLGKTKQREQQEARLQAEKNNETGLFGKTPHYFDQNLALFGLGWSEKRFYFDDQGRLGVNWK